jgi:hypothetical protein
MGTIQDVSNNKRKTEDKDLDQLAIKTKVSPEWPMKWKVKWSIQKLLARGQRRLLKIWLRYVESLRDEQEMVHICDPKSRRDLSDDEEKMRSVDLMNCQVSNEEESSYFHVGNEMGSLEDLIDF